MSHQNQVDPFKRVYKFLKNLKLLSSPVVELYFGIKSNTIPWHFCASWAVGVTFLLLFKIDHFLIILTPLRSLYPYYSPFYKIYAFSLITLGFWIWAWNQVRTKKEKLESLTSAFKNAGLESKIGRLPNLISDFALDPIIRKMRVTNAGFPLSKFQEQARYLESELGIFIDMMKEERTTRVINIIYSHFPMTEKVEYTIEDNAKSLEYQVGRTRAHKLTANFHDTPHLLIAGQTGGGKSTFLRQLIVHTHLHQKSARFLLIDLKGGLEFSLFEKRSAFSVVPSVLAAVEELKKIDKLLDDRMARLKSQQCKDLESYLKKANGNPTFSVHRQFVVVDEAAEMFLAGHHANTKDIQAARAILSRVARQGRACGVHLIVATQRPDSKSLDPQVKANLTGVVCFQMMNDASSIAVLGNGRATDLPKIPGRAIWKNGIEMIEVQTPYLSAEEAEQLLGKPDQQEDQTTSTPNSSEADNQPKFTPLDGTTQADKNALGVETN